MRQGRWWYAFLRIELLVFLNLKILKHLLHVTNYLFSYIPGVILVMNQTWENWKNSHLIFSVIQISPVGKEWMEMINCHITPFTEVYQPDSEYWESYIKRFNIGYLFQSLIGILLQKTIYCNSLFVDYFFFSKTHCWIKRS